MKKNSTAVRKQHRILTATDGSRTAQAALATAVKFPWPASVQVRAVVARSSWLPAASEHARAAVEESFVVGFDGCPHAERALDFLGSLEPVRGSRAVLVKNVVEPAIAPASLGRFPASVRSHIRGEVAALNEERQQQGQATVVAGAARLERSGWTVQTEVRAGAPLASLLKAVGEHRADVLVLGARARSGVDRVLLGSVANGALNSSPVVLLVN